MPYEPGNQNNAAQYIAQAGTDVAAGIRQFQQNDLMRSTDISKFYSTAKEDTDLVKFLSDPTKAPPAVAKIYQKLDSTGHISVAEAAQLGSFTDLYTKNKVEQQTSAARKAQTDLATAQGLQVGQQTKDLQAKSAQDASDQAAFQKATSGPKEKLIENFFAYGGSVEGAKRLGFDVDKYLGASGVGSMEPYIVDLGNGVKAIYSPKTGGFSPLPQTPEQIAAAESAKADAANTSLSSVKELDALSSASDLAQDNLRTLSRIEGLYSQPGVSTGWAQPAITEARAILDRFGVKTEGLANQQQLEKELNNLVLDRGKEFMKGGGSVSNFERQLISNALANPSLTKEANLAILQVMKLASQRQVALEDLRTQLEQKGMSPTEIAKSLRSAKKQIMAQVDQQQKDLKAEDLLNPSQLASARAPKANVPPLLAAPGAQGQGGGGDLPAGWTLKGNP